MTHQSLDISVRVETTDAIIGARGEACADRLGVQCTFGERAAVALPVLAFADDGVELRADGELPGRGLQTDLGGLRAQRQRGPLGKKHPLGKAIGAAKTVIDATGGMGQDTLLLACMGYRVVVLERHPVVHELLLDGVRRARADVVLANDARRVEVNEVPSEAAESLRQMRADVVYLDPMFPEKFKSTALPPKSMQIFQRLLGPDDDAADLVGIALQIASSRVVVKRPTHAPELVPGVTQTYPGKLVRYDMYHCQLATPFGGPSS